MDLFTSAFRTRKSASHTVLAQHRVCASHRSFGQVSPAMCVGETDPRAEAIRPKSNIKFQSARSTTDGEAFWIGGDTNRPDSMQGRKEIASEFLCNLKISADLLLVCLAAGPQFLLHRK
jgi:hypothetical protein